MCGIYYQGYPCLSYQISLSVFTVVCPCIALTFTSTLRGGGVKAYLITAQPNLAHNLGLLDIPGFTLLILCGGINP